jgi:phage anti-repressor protein
MDVIIANAMSEGGDLFKLLRDNMNTEEQELFMDSFKMYLQHGNDDDAFVVNLDDVWEWMGFVKKFNALRLLQKLFTEEKDFITQNNSLLREERVQHGGQNKETILMSVQTFKMLCFQANTEKAKRVRGYYIKMEKVMQKYIEKLMIDAKAKLEDDLKKKQLKMDEIEENAAWERHKALINAYRNKPLVYILFIENVEDGMVIKLGSSDQIQERVTKICNDFQIHNQIKVLHVFPSDHFRRFEDSLKKDNRLSRYQYTKRINNHAYSTETYLMKNKNTLKSLVNFIQSQALHFKAMTIEERLLIFNTECLYERRNIHETYRNDPVKLYKMYNLMDSMQSRAFKSKFNTEIVTEPFIDKIDVSDTVPNVEPNMFPNDDYDPDDGEIDQGNTEPPSRDSRERKSCGPKVQLYNPSDLSKVDRVICGIFQVLIDMPGTSLTQIKTATKNKTVYKGYRWYLIPQDDPDPNRPREIGGTNELQERKVGLVAMLNLDKTIVERVFRTQEEAASEFTFHKSLMSNAVKYDAPYQGKCWVFWETLDQGIQNEFLKTNKLPIQRNPRAKRVQRLHPDTLEVLQEYDSISHVYTSDRITAKSIKGAIDENQPFGGFRWNIMNVGE